MQNRKVKVKEEHSRRQVWTWVWLFHWLSPQETVGAPWKVSSNNGPLLGAVLVSPPLSAPPGEKGNVNKERLDV